MPPGTTAQPDLDGFLDIPNDELSQIFLSLSSSNDQRGRGDVDFAASPRPGIALHFKRTGDPVAKSRVEAESSAAQPLNAGLIGGARAPRLAEERADRSAPATMAKRQYFRRREYAILRATITLPVQASPRIGSTISRMT
jgi:hypothetical protein